MGSRSLFHVVAVPRAFFGTFFRFERKYYPFGAAAPPLAPESARQAPHSQQTFRSAERTCGRIGAFLHSLHSFIPNMSLNCKPVSTLVATHHAPLIKQARTFYPFPTKKAGSPTFSMGLPAFYFILARADSAVAHNTVLAPAKPYNDSASHSGRNTPPVRSPDDRCAAAADSSPADAALAGIPPTASA